MQGDFGALPFTDDSFDTVVFHQVLHYAQEPAYALAEAARVCCAGGRIAIVDLAAHEREELRSRHAHARLGFTEQQIADMFRDHGFEDGRSMALNGGELTVKIWTAIRADDAIPSIAPTDKSPAKKAASQ